MHNPYVVGSDAHYAVKQAREVCEQAARANSDIEDAFVEIIEQLDTAIAEASDFEAAYDDLEKQVKDLEEKLEAIDPNSIITQMDHLEQAGDALARFAVETRMKVRDAYGLVESSDGSSGTDSNGSSENPVNESTK